MKNYEAYSADAEISGEIIIGFIECMKRGRDARIAMLAKHNIIDVTPGKWYNAQSYLNVQQEMEQTMGENTLYLIGLATGESAILPPVSSLTEYFSMMDVALHMNSRLGGKVLFDPTTGQITDGVGHFIVQEYDAVARKAVVLSSMRSSQKMEEGCILGLVRKFAPKDSDPNALEVKEDISKERKSQGAETSTYLISW